MTKADKIEYLAALKERLVRESRTSLLKFTLATMPTFAPADFHKRYYQVLTDFADGKIKKLMVFMPPQHGKEISDSILVPTPKGFVKHGDLKVGDYVFGRDGNPVMVKWVSEKVMSEYDVTFSDGQTIQCHGNHEWVVYDRSYAKERVLETKYMLSQKLGSGIPNKRGHRYRFQVDSNIPVSMPDAELPIISAPYTRRRAIVSIEKSKNPEQGNCIEVEGGVYLVGKTYIPTHNSEGSTRRLPAFILGRDPNRKVAVVSYSAPKARKFNREIQRVIDTAEYNEIFPNTVLNASNVTTVAGSWLRNADECEIVGHRGGFKTVGVGGALTGEPVDTLIMDDIYKDAKTAWSPTVRESVEDWYDTVAETRLHNDSQQLMVFTRWHEKDLAGRLLEQQGVYDPIKNPDGWVVIIYRAIKVGKPTEYDPREEGEPLWPDRHNLGKLEAVRSRSPHVFESLYQQDPKPLQGLMYEQGFKEYEVIPYSKSMYNKAYIDTADEGEDYLCAVCYTETQEGIFVTDILYTQKAMEYTEPKTAEMLTKHKTQYAIIESNNGGRSFARNVEKQCRILKNTKTRFKWFHQSDNKAVRIFSHSADVQNMVHFPKGWDSMWPDFYNAITNYMKVGKNEHDDAPDAITGTFEWIGKGNSQNLSEFF